MEEGVQTQATKGVNLECGLMEPEVGRGHTSPYQTGSTEDQQTMSPLKIELITVGVPWLNDRCVLGAQVQGEVLCSSLNSISAVVAGGDVKQKSHSLMCRAFAPVQPTSLEDTTSKTAENTAVSFLLELCLIQDELWSQR